MLSFETTWLSKYLAYEFPAFCFLPEENKYINKQNFINYFNHTYMRRIWYVEANSFSPHLTFQSFGSFVFTHFPQFQVFPLGDQWSRLSQIHSRSSPDSAETCQVRDLHSLPTGLAPKSPAALWSPLYSSLGEILAVLFGSLLHPCKVALSLRHRLQLPMGFT